MNLFFSRPLLTVAVLFMLPFLAPLPALAFEKGGAAPQDNPALQTPLTYEGASTIGTRIMPEAAKLFSKKKRHPLWRHRRQGRRGGIQGRHRRQSLSGGAGQQPEPGGKNGPGRLAGHRL